MYCEGEHAKIEGRKHLYANDTDTCDGFAFAVNTTMQGFNLEDDVNQFRRFKQSMKTCFWSLFDPGHPEVIGCTQVIFTDFRTYFLYIKIERVHQDTLECSSGLHIKLEMLSL